MTFPMSFVVAQAAPAAGGPGGLLAGPGFLLIMIAMFGVMYFTSIRPQMKRQKELRAMVAALSKGDEIITNGGIAGRVDDIGDTFITVEVAPTVKIKVQKGAVQQVLPKGTLKSS